MKCEICLELLEEYLDGELTEETNEQLDAHLITCTECSESFAALTAEQEVFAHYDRELEVSPFLWTRVAAHTVAEKQSSKSGWLEFLDEMFATPGAVVATIIILFGLLVVAGLNSDGYFRAIKGDPNQVNNSRSNYPPPETPKKSDKELPVEPHDNPKPAPIASVSKPRPRVRPTTTTHNQSDVLSSDTGYLDMDDRDTARHIEQTQILLRSIKNVAIADGDDEIDVTYDKALSRRLLNENVVLRRDAEMKAKFPTKMLLSDLEPFLIDIANLPDRARAEDVRVIKERVRKTEIVAALVDYQDRGTNNR
ncbi:MAG TPA: zf-HC2 domain-containing protein [Pyrinomonadaceae bacterium]|nr:zf-HC2 domain-containing protein [Pyrinomonadaceae bacterium]